MSTEIDLARVQERIKARAKAAEVLDYIKSERDAFNDDDLGKHFAETIYYLMADTLGLVDHGDDVPVGYQPVVPTAESMSTVGKTAPEGHVWIETECGAVTQESDKAYLIQWHGDGVWMPKSQLADEFETGQEVEGFWCTEWIAKEKALL